MTLAVPGPPSLSFTSRAPSIIIIGADAMLAALPATPVQLAHACMKAGFQHVVPASWGDELIASAVARQVEDRPGQPLVQCTCPLVAHRLLSVGTDLGPFLVTLAPPPVALARYLRALYGSARLRLTYVGRCPGAEDEVIDTRLTPDELFAMFADRHLALGDQPEVFDSVIPPDRRRHSSQPGGVPTPDVLWTEAGGRTLVEITTGDLTVELAQLLLTEQNVLIDPAPLLGCACSGVTARSDAPSARERVVSLEPPRAASPIVDSRVGISLAPSLPSHTRTSVQPALPPREVMLPVHDSTEYAPVGIPNLGARQVAPASHATAIVDAPPSSSPWQELAALPAADLQVASSDPVVSTRAANELPAFSADEASAAMTEQEMATAVFSALPDEYTHAVGDADEAQTYEGAPQAVALEQAPTEHEAASRSTSGGRRTAPFGTLRAVVGETPMTRDSSGRQLPRAYVVRRRSSPRSAPVVEELPGEVHSPSSAEEALPQPSDNDTAVQTAAPERVPTPSFEAAAPEPHPTAVLPNVVHSLDASVAEAEPPVMDRVRPAPNASPEPRREQERTVALPVERLSDAPVVGRATQPRMQTTHVAPPADEKPTKRTWVWIALLVLVVALIGSAAGAAFATWYAQQHPAVTTTR